MIAAANKVVYSRDGYPVFVRSNLVNEFPGQRLLRRGHHNEAEPKSSVEVDRGKGQRHGTSSQLRQGSCNAMPTLLQARTIQVFSINCRSISNC